MPRTQSLKAAVRTVVLTSALILPAGVASHFAGGSPPVQAAVLAMDSYSGGPSKRDMAYQDAIFIGEVVAANGAIDVTEDFDASLPMALPAYAVDVETTLKGEVVGRINVGVMETMLADEMGTQFEVGKRYLISATKLTADKSYAITEGFDNIEIGSDYGEATLIAEFKILIELVEREHWEELAEEDAIFIGRVVAEISRDTIVQPESYPILVARYAVDVETALKGAVEDRVDVSVLWADLTGTDAVEVGRRYLFAAAGPWWDGAYTIQEGYHNIPIADDQAAATLVTEFTQLVEDDRRYPPPVEPYDPCFYMASPPTLEIEPTEGRAGSIVHVMAGNLVTPDTFIFWEDADHDYVDSEILPVRADCTMDEEVTVPVDAQLGRYEIIVEGAVGFTAGATFEVIDRELH